MKRKALVPGGKDTWVKEEEEQVMYQVKKKKKEPCEEREPRVNVKV